MLKRRRDLDAESYRPSRYRITTITITAMMITFVGTLLGESGSRSPARIGCLMVLRRGVVSFSGLLAPAGSITARPSGRRLVGKVRIAEPTSTLSPSARERGSASVIPLTVVGLTPHGCNTYLPSSDLSSAWLRDTAGSRIRIWLAASRPIVRREFLTG